MSLNKFFDLELGKAIGLKIGCVDMDCGNMVVNNIVMPTGSNLDAHDIKVENNLSVSGSTNIGGNNYVTPGLGMPTWSLHTDGNGNTYWDVDSIGSDGIQYAGTPPTIAGQLVRFSTISGQSAEQSNIIDNGTSLNLGGQLITNASSYNGVDIESLDTRVGDNENDITTLNGLINQSVNTGANVLFGDITSTKLTTPLIDVSGGSAVWSVSVVGDGLELITSNNSAKHRYANGFNYFYRSDTALGGVGMVYYKSFGTLDAPTAIINNTSMFEQYSNGHDGVEYDTGVLLTSNATENWTAGNHGSSWKVSTTNNGETAVTEKLLINSDGTKITGDLKIEGGSVEKTIAGTNALGVSDVIKKSRGTLTAPTAVLAGDVLYSQSFKGYDSVQFSEGANMKVEADENWFDTDGFGTKMTIKTTDSGDFNPSDKITIASNGITFMSGLNSYRFPLARNANIGYALRTIDGNGRLDFVKNVYGEMFFNGNATATIMGVLGQYYRVGGGVASSSLLNGFTLGTNLLTYTSTPRIFKASVNVSWRNGGNTPRVFGLAIWKNDVNVNASLQAAVLDDSTAAYPRNCSTECIVSLTSGDTISVAVACLDDTDNVIVNNMSFNIIEVSPV